MRLIVKHMENVKSDCIMDEYPDIYCLTVDLSVPPVVHLKSTTKNSPLKAYYAETEAGSRERA